MEGVAGNIAKREDAEALTQRAIKEVDVLDVVVNNAGIMHQM